MLGGAINEKDTHGACNEDLAFHLHGIFGLDHYPNYLLKWKMEDINELETRLEACIA